VDNAGSYDVVVIGAGMAGLAAAIRLRMAEKRVLLVERHNAPGGLNSFYAQGGRKFDVGLHALTNYAPPGKRGPLTKIFRQLRINRDDWDLAEQFQSRIVFPGVDLAFSNDYAFFEAQVADRFPRSIDGLRRLVAEMDALEATRLEARWTSSRERLDALLPDPLLREMILCPVMFYGSAEEHDMDFNQFTLLYRALFLEGFARPYAGVRQIIKSLLQRYRELKGEKRMKCGVKAFLSDGPTVKRLELDDGTVIETKAVLSTIGRLETDRLAPEGSLKKTEVATESPSARVGQLSFAETISIFPEQPRDLGWEDTIVFFNQEEKFHYEKTGERQIDLRSGVICFPNNYDYSGERQLEEGFLRVTAQADWDFWSTAPEEIYRAAKETWFPKVQDTALAVLPKIQGKPFAERVIATDMFTPRTIHHYTGHLGGAVYGSPDKQREGTTDFENVFLAGTDQGFLGIVGAILSGISIANRYLV
jgi:phytoene dehydrogenase-like protein